MCIRDSRGGQAGVEDERPGGVDQMLDDPGRAEDRAALGAECLGERHGGHHIGVPGEPGGRHRATSAVAQHAQPVRVIDEERGTVCPAGRGERTQRCGIAVHGEHRIGHGQRPPLMAGERGAYGLRVGVRGDLRTGPGQAAAVDQGGVVARVGDEEGGAVGERGDGGEVGRIARGQHQRRLEAAERGQFGLQLGVQFGAAGHQAGAGRARAPLPGGAGGGIGDLGVAGQSEIVVAGQVQQRGGGGAGPQRTDQPGAPAVVVRRVDPVEGRAGHRPYGSGRGGCNGVTERRGG